MSEKTMKQKCLDMWLYFKEHPEHDKDDYKSYLYRVGRDNEFTHCWACASNNVIDPLNEKNCLYCPIKWDNEICQADGEAYDIWEKSFDNEEDWDEDYDREQAIDDMIELIETTWKEGGHNA